MSDLEIIGDLYKKYWQYMIEKDAEKLSGLMSGDYILTHMTGVRQNKEVFLQGLMEGTFNYYSADHDDIKVNIDGNKATMIGKSRVVAAVYGGRRSSWRLRGDFILEKINGEWKFTSSKASTY